MRKQMGVLILAIVAFFVALVLPVAVVAQSPPSPPSPGVVVVPVVIKPGWNLVAGTGETPQALSARTECVSVVYGFDADGQFFTHWFRGVPDYVNAYRPVEVLEPGAGYWVYCEASG